MCYAKSEDEGKTWKKSTGEVYELPITMDTAEVAVAIPQNRELINTSSTAVTSKGNPITCQYWMPEGGKDTPQFHLVFHDGKEWQVGRSLIGRLPTRFGTLGGSPCSLAARRYLWARTTGSM